MPQNPLKLIEYRFADTRGRTSLNSRTVTDKRSKAMTAIFISNRGPTFVKSGTENSTLCSSTL